MEAKDWITVSRTVSHCLLHVASQPPTSDRLPGHNKWPLGHTDRIFGYTDRLPGHNNWLPGYHDWLTGDSDWLDIHTDWRSSSRWLPQPSPPSPCNPPPPFNKCYDQDQNYYVKLL